MGQATSKRLQNTPSHPLSRALLTPYPQAITTSQRHHHHSLLTRFLLLGTPHPPARRAFEKCSPLPRASHCTWNNIQTPTLLCGTAPRQCPTLGHHTALVSLGSPRSQLSLASGHSHLPCSWGRWVTFIATTSEKPSLSVKSDDVSSPFDPLVSITAPCYFLPNTDHNF